jgi:hypothetical protein
MTNTYVTSPSPRRGAMPKEGLSARFAPWMALYGAFLFLAGWGYLKNYFIVYGINSGWLDFGFNDTVVHGFTVLFGSGVLLSIVYLIIFLLSLFAEVFYSNRSRIVDAVLVSCLVILFPITYKVARTAGISQANIDRGEKTGLPTVAFTAGACDYKGKLVYIKGESFYVYDLAYLPAPAKSVTCPIDLSGISSEVPLLWLIRAADLKNVRVVHFQKEAKS